MPRRAIIREEPDWRCTLVLSWRFRRSASRTGRWLLRASGREISELPRARCGSAMLWSAAGCGPKQAYARSRYIPAGASISPPQLSWSPCSPTGIGHPSRYVVHGSLPGACVPGSKRQSRLPTEGETLDFVGRDLERTVRIPAAGVILDGDLVIPGAASGVVVFAHGSGSSRHSPRNRSVAASLQTDGYATLLMDLLTPEEELVD